MTILSLLLVAVVAVSVSGQEQEAIVRSDIIGVGGDLPLLLSRTGVGDNDNDNDNDNVSDSDSDSDRHSEVRSHRHRRHLRPLKLETHKDNNENEDEMMMECVLYIKVMIFENYQKESYSCEFTQEQSKLYGLIPDSTTGSDVDIDGGINGDRGSISDNISPSFSNYIMDIVGITKSEIDLKTAGGGIMNIISGGILLKSKFAYVESNNDEYDAWSMSLYIGQEAGGQEVAGYDSRAGIGNDSLFILETLDEMNDPRHANNRRRERQRQRNLVNSRPGTIKAFVVRVQGLGGSKIDASIEQLQDDVFKDELCLKSQYAACSKDQLIIEPVADYNDNNGARIEGGIGTIDTPYINNAQDFVRVVNEAVDAKYGQHLSGLNFPDLTLFCLPPNLNSGLIAFAYLNGHKSYYKGTYCQYPFFQMHEVGHNFGFHHSMEKGDPYGDRSGYMGNGIPAIISQDATPEMKNFQIGWYDKQKLSINPLDFPTKSQKFVLTGVGNYDKNKGTTAELITLRLENTGDGIGTNKSKDYYIGFNSNISPNKDTQDGINLVLVTEKEGPVNSSRPSNLIGKLNLGNSITLTNYRNTRSDVTITVTAVTVVTATIQIDVFDPITIPCQEDNGKVELRLEIYTDSLPIESSWTISTVEKQNELSYYGGGYYSSFTKSNQLVCLKTSSSNNNKKNNTLCYVFTIFDTSGDFFYCKGSNDPKCQTGEGFYKGYLLSVDGNGNSNSVLIFEGDILGVDEQQIFCVDTPTDSPTTETPITNTITNCVNNNRYAFKNKKRNKRFRKYCQRKVRKRPNKLCNKFDKKNKRRVRFYCPLYCKEECKVQQQQQQQ